MKIIFKILPLLLILSLIGACKKDQSGSNSCITLNPAIPIVNQTISFTDCSSGAISAAWDFGNGNTGNGIIATNTYTSAGTYTITLTSTTTGGQTTTVKKNIVVSTLPNAAFQEKQSCNAYFSTNISIGVSSMLNFAPIASAQKYSWNFGDGTTSHDSMPTHIFIQPGTYTVKLTVSNSIGSDSSYQTISVVAPYYNVEFLLGTNTQATINNVSGYNIGGTFSIEYYLGGSSTFLMTATITTPPAFIIPSQPVSINGQAATVHGQGTTLALGTCTQKIYLIDTIVINGSAQILIDTFQF
jgi:PKD repeat protein